MFSRKAGCLDLSPITLNGGPITYPDRNGTLPWPIGTVAQYTCAAGYFFILNSGAETSTCGSNGQWVGDPPACGVPCLVLVETRGMSITYNYNEEPRGLPGTRRAGVSAAISCTSGYTVVGSGTGTCQPNGAWSNNGTTCQITCPDLFVSNGKVSYSGGQAVDGSRSTDTVATYSCNHGFSAVGGSNTSLRTCQLSGSWSGSSLTCQNCPSLTPPTGGTIYFSSGSRLIDTVATYSCNTGYFLVGVGTLTCQAGQSVGTWSSDPPSCELICPDLTPPVHGEIVYSDPRPALLRAEGSTATFRCDNGYAPSGLNMRTCTTTGWSTVSQPLLCTFVDCGPLTDPGNGQVTTNRNTYLGVATYSCDSGYIQNGDRFQTCMATGQWSHFPPTCDAVDCGEPPELINGRTTYTATTSGSIAAYSCNSGYTIVGSSSRRCQASGRWSSASLFCDAPCPHGTISNGIVMYSSNSDPSPVGTVATYFCDTGYTLTGNERRTCENGTGWSGSLPICNVISCGPLVNPPNGQVRASSGNTFNQVATYSCDSGYSLTGSMTRTCGANGDWTDEAPQCISMVKSDSDTVVLMGGVVGGVLAIAIVIMIPVVVIVLVCIWHRKTGSKNVENQPTSNIHSTDLPFEYEFQNDIYERIDSPPNGNSQLSMATCPAYAIRNINQ